MAHLNHQSHSLKLGPIKPKELARELRGYCAWRDHPGDRKCGMPTVDHLPVCYAHGLRVAGYMTHVVRQEEEDRRIAMGLPTDEAMEAAFEQEERERLAARAGRQPFVYYLMLAPDLVKIGTTRDLKSRIRRHGSKLQYVVALELGGRELEKARHDQFPMERHGVREIFTVSPELREHIEKLVPMRDELMELALKTPDQNDDTPIDSGG